MPEGFYAIISPIVFLVTHVVVTAVRSFSGKGLNGEGIAKTSRVRHSVEEFRPLGLQYLLGAIGPSITPLPASAGATVR